MADEQNNGTIDPSNDTGDDQVIIDESLDAEAKVVALTEQNKKLFERTKKAEGFTKQPDGSWVKKPKPTETIIKKDESPRESVKPSDILRSPEFSLHREGYNEDEIDLIMRNGGREILKDEKNPIVVGLKVTREQRIAEAAASKAQDTSGMSELERKYTKTDLEKMSVAELEKILPHAN